MTKSLGSDRNVYLCLSREVVLVAKRAAVNEDRPLSQIFADAVLDKYRPRAVYALTSGAGAGGTAVPSGAPSNVGPSAEQASPREDAERPTGDQ